MARLTPDEIAALRRLMGGPGSDLWIPAHLAAASSRPGANLAHGPEFVVPPTLQDVSGSPSPPKELWEILQVANPVATLCALAGLNVLLETVHLDPTLEQAAAERYVRPEFRTSAIMDTSKGKLTTRSFSIASSF
jgi:hypothetical protein